MAKSSRVKNKKPSLIQITDSAELSDYQFRTRKQFEDRSRRARGNLSEWVKYAKWEESQKYFSRARSIFERALFQCPAQSQNPILWLNYAEFEMRNGSFDLARNVWDRAVSNLPSVNQLWYKYIHMEEVTLGNIAKARQLFQRWVELEPDAQCWFSYASFELRYGEVDRARDIYERLVRCDISPDAWAQYAKFEMKNGELQRCRAIYLRATQIVRPEDREALFLAFAMDPTTCIHNGGEHQGVVASVTMKRYHASKLRNESRDIQYHASEKRNGIPEDGASSMRRHIPNDLMLNILSRVPARSLVRFRCACKVWNSLFHDRYFVKLQLNHSAKNPTTFIGCTSNENWDRVIFFSFELEADKLVCGDKFTVPVPVEFDELYHMTNACDGLIGFYGSWFAFVANPSTREWMAVPMGRANRCEEFDLEMRKPSLGLGFSKATEKYKLVLIYYDGGWSCDVVTIGTDRTWRRLGKIHYRVDTTFSPAYSNGFIYWTVYGDDFLLALNVSQEEFVKIPLPQHRHPKPYGDRPAYCYLYMRILEGSLCLVDYRVYRRSIYVPFMHIYMLESHSAAEGGDPPVWRESHNLRLTSVKDRPHGGGPAQFTMLPTFIRDDKLLIFRYYNTSRLHDTSRQLAPAIKLPQEESSLFRGWSTSFTCAASIAPILGC